LRHGVLRAEELEVSDSRGAAHRILQVGGHEVGNVRSAHTVVGRDEATASKKFLADFRPEHPAAYRLRQAAQRELQLVLHLYLREYRIRALRKAQRDVMLRPCRSPRTW